MEHTFTPNPDDPEAISRQWICDQCQWIAGTAARARSHYILRGHGCREALIDEHGNEWVVR